MIFSPVGVVAFSLLAFPITYGFNYLMKYTGDDHRIVFGAAVLVIFTIGVLFYVLSKYQKQRPKDNLFYVFVLFSFTGIIDLITSLEIDGHIRGFMTVYLKEGEPYLKTSHCTLACYYDGTVHYVMYIIMAIRCLQNKDYRNLGIYWSGSMTNIVLVFLIGNVIGKYSDDVKASYLLTIPYLLVPVVVGYLMIKRDRNVKFQPKLIEAAHNQDILSRPIDVLLITYMIYAIFISTLRGLAALDCTWPSVQGYLARFEPYIGDPVGYPRVQMLIYLFYYVPYYAVTICGLIFPGHQWMLDWSILHAGATSQAQIIHMCASFHKRTFAAFRPPLVGRQGFLFVNTILQTVPQILAWRCHRYPEFFQQLPVDKEKKAQ
ncbi:transmembrane 6 superfamily member 1-like [Glandiceps talaboti]